MRKLSFMERWGVVAFLMVGIIYGYLEFYRDPLVKEYGELVKKNNSLVKAVQEAEMPQATDKVALSISKLKKQLSELNMNLQEAIEEQISDESREEEMVMRISEMAANNGLRVGTLAPYRPGKQELFARVQSEQKMLSRSLYHVQLSGNFISLYEFFRELASLPSLVNVTQLNIQRSKESRDVDVELLFVI